MGDIRLTGADGLGVTRAVAVDALHNLLASLGTLLAGEANHTSSTASYLRTHRKCNLNIVSKTTAVVIGGGAANDTMLIGLYIHTALTGTCAITGFADTDGTAQTYTIPAGYVGFVDFFGAVNSAGALTITCSNAGDDNKVAVFWFGV